MLPASLKNEPSKNERQNETENKDRKSEHSDSRPKSQRFCIFIFSHRTFFKNNFCQRTNGTFGFCKYTSQHFKKPKKPFFNQSIKEFQLIIKKNNFKI